MRLVILVATVVLAVQCFLSGAVADDRSGKPIVSDSASAAATREVRQLAGIKGGVIVHLDCGDGRMTAALADEGNVTVHGLEADPAAVARARRHIQSRNLYGPVSAEQFSGSRLPYADNLVNMVVAGEQGGAVSRDEMMRVLAPGGVLLTERDGKWEKRVKPWPDSIDDWSHFLHDAGNNAVADDTVVGPPRSLQWVAPPLWLRSHETPSGIQASVSAGGRLFYIFDRGLIGITDERLPDRWSLVCRDAFNGRLLWERPMTSWGWRQWNRQRYEGLDWTTLRAARLDVPDENHRRLVATADRVFVTLSHEGPMSMLDAATGKVIATFEETDGTREILVSGGVAVAHTHPMASERSRRRGEVKTGSPPTLVAVDAVTGAPKWKKICGAIPPLHWVINNGRIIAITPASAGKGNFVARNLEDGRELWRVQTAAKWSKTLIAVDDVIVLNGGAEVAAHDTVTGKVLWKNKVKGIHGVEALDLFVIDGMVWRGLSGKSDVVAVGWDLRTGEEKKRIAVKNLRSPEHHHRCYRNKATARYIISSFEGAEFLDVQGDNHGQNNWVRGACKYGMMPCNGMLYAPPDQCFCQPGSKVLGFTALTSGSAKPWVAVDDASRLERGPEYGAVVKSAPVNDGDWPTFRHDAARSGTTSKSIDADIKIAWQEKLGGRLTVPVAAGGRLYIAQADAHTLHALDMKTGAPLWQFTAGGRIDSPPTIHDGYVLTGSRDGYVYCLRSDNGGLVWRFLAAPVDRRIGHFDQIESAWPVHGSILVCEGVAYFTAGRSTYLDGGIRVFGLDPKTGKVIHKGLLEGPHRKTGGERDVAFFIPGANSDVLVSEGGFIYMRQKKLSLDLKEIEPKVLSRKGEKDVGLHIFSTAGLLDDSWYNRTFWMYSKRWPGFQLANQAPKAGQLLVVDDERTYAVRVFHRRNVHSPMFFPGTEGYLVFADKNTNEPQIVGEEGAREPLEWLPQSDYATKPPRKARLGSRAFGADKMIGYTRAEKPEWMSWLPVRVRGMVKAGPTLFVAGAPDVLDPQDPYAAFENRKAASVVALNADSGKKLSESKLAYPPVFDGMIAAGGRLFIATTDGSVICMSPLSR